MSEAKWWCIKASNFESTKGTRKLDPFFLVYSLFTIAWMMVSTATLLLSSVSRHRKHGSPVGKINEWVMGTAHPPPPINFWCCQMFASLMERQAWIPIPTSSVCNWLGDSFFWYCPSSWNQVGRGMDALLRLCPVLTPGSHPEAKQGRGACVQMRRQWSSWAPLPQSPSPVAHFCNSPGAVPESWGVPRRQT